VGLRSDRPRLPGARLILLGFRKSLLIACLAICRRSSRDSPIGGSSGSPAIGWVGLPQPRSRIEFAAETRAASLLPDVAILTSVSIATRLCLPGEIADLDENPRPTAGVAALTFLPNHCFGPDTNPHILVFYTGRS
jgi:hypothetical protein